MDPRLCPCVMRSTSHGCARCTGRGTATGKTFKARLAKLERWLAPRCRAVRALQFTSTRNVYSSQTRMTALVVEAARLSLRTIDVCVGQQGPDTDVAKQKGSVLAFSLAIHQCQALTHLKIRVLEMHSLCALGLAALPQSLQRLQLSCSPGHVPGSRTITRPPRVPIERRVVDLAVLRGLPHLTSVVLGPHFPLTCSVPAGLSCLTELEFDTWSRVVFVKGLEMPGLQRLVLVPHSIRPNVRLPALQGLPGLTALCVNQFVLVPRDLTPLRLLRQFCQLARGQQALPWQGEQTLPWTPVLPESVIHLQAAAALQASPEQALALQQLAHLDLSQNCFCALPAGMTVLSNLQHLALGFSSFFAIVQPGTLRILDAAALGDLSAFPCMTSLTFSHCQVAFSDDFGLRHHARLDNVSLEIYAKPCRGSSAAALLALHRQLVGSGRRGVEARAGLAAEWVRLADEYDHLCMSAAALSCS